MIGRSLRHYRIEEKLGEGGSQISVLQPASVSRKRADHDQTPPGSSPPAAWPLPAQQLLH